jgi:hypothetical protein
LLVNTRDLFLSWKIKLNSSLIDKRIKSYGL